MRQLLSDGTETITLFLGSSFSRHDFAAGADIAGEIFLIKIFFFPATAGKFPRLGLIAVSITLVSVSVSAFASSSIHAENFTGRSVRSPK